MEQQEVAHEGVGAGVGEVVAGRGHEENLGAFAVIGDGRVDAGDPLVFLGEEVDHVLHGLGGGPDVAALVVALGHRGHGPIDVDAHGAEELPAQDGHLRHVDAVGAEQRAAPAFGALVEIEEPLFQHIFREVPGPGNLSQESAGLFEVALVHRAQELGPEHRHVLGVPGAQEEVALVGAGPATDADIEKDLQGTEPVEPVLHTLQDDFLPVRRQPPVLVHYRPGMGIGIADPLHPLGIGRIAIGARPEVRFDVHPPFVGGLVAYPRQYFLWFWNFYLSFCHVTPAPFRLGSQPRSWPP